MRASTHIAIISALTLLLALSGYSQSNSGWSGGQQSQRFSSPRQSSENGSHSMGRTISGQIRGFRHENVTQANGSQQKHSLVRVETDNGQFIAVDLGPKSNVDQLSLQQGDQIQARGQFAKVSGERVFVADHVRVHGLSFAVQPSQQASGSQFAQGRNQSQFATLSGTIQGFRQMKLRGSQGEQQVHTLAKLQLDNGRTTVVDLGPKEGLNDLDLQKGQHIRMQAQQGTLDNHRILLVNRLGFENPNRSSSQQSAQGQRGQQQQQQQQFGQQQSGQQVTLQGTVKGYQIMSIGTGNQQQVLLSLDLQNGRSVLVNAGQYQPGELNLKNLDLNDQVTIQAHRINSGNGQQLVADSIQFENATGGTSNQQESQSGGSNSNNDNNNSNE